MTTVKSEVGGLLSDEEYARFAVKAKAVEEREPDPNSPLKEASCVLCGEPLLKLEAAIGVGTVAAPRDRHVKCVIRPQIGPGMVLTIDGVAKAPLSARDRLYAAHARFCAEAFDLMRKKNADYASAEDPLMNFRAGGLLGIVIRKGDKAIRDINVTRKGGAAVAETLKDTRLDEINYAILALYAEEEGMLP
jgi:hypothetical protein